MNNNIVIYYNALKNWPYEDINNLGSIKRINPKYSFQVKSGITQNLNIDKIRRELNLHFIIYFWNLKMDQSEGEATLVREVIEP
jgi:hypothetical protein